ncbi:hypothetical protein MARPU_05630 [Marichromatium purpuratum 984]|uniref:Uncharacterized protein n=1 Tax=Marichromatium purpuratum 984 TaxID=765910 RepID=W0E8L9_MARPU|nr:hypothetical protein [Marichromatium purpuratum]AHF05406.1 hypothetical protein MARPU_05630 [Marichromatium purpuratum 984]
MNERTSLMRPDQESKETLTLASEIAALLREGEKRGARPLDSAWIAIQAEYGGVMAIGMMKDYLGGLSKT